MLQLFDRLAIEKTTKFLRHGVYRKKHQYSTTDKLHYVSYYVTSAVGDGGQVKAAVKVVPKLAELGGSGGDVICDGNVAKEIEILAKLAGTPGVVELMSWSETHFHVNLCFPVYQHSLLDVIALLSTEKSAVGDKIDVLPQVAKQLLDALSRVHTAKIVHGDIKPGSILATAPSALGDIKVVIADFGSAAEMDVIPGSPESYTILEGNCNTTYEYRAPELFLPKPLRAISYAADVWAMGCVIIEIETYRPLLGRDQVGRCDLGALFKELLWTLYRATPCQFPPATFSDRAMFIGCLFRLQLREVTQLPWAKERAVPFKQLLASFFVADPRKRPSASTLALDQALANALP